MTDENPGQKFDRARKLADGGKLADAEKVLGDLLKDDPGHKGALDLMGFVLFFQKRYAEAEACCVKSLDRYPDNAYAMNGRGLCLAKQGRVEEGLGSIRRAMEAKPAWFEPYWDYLVTCGEHGRKDLAEPILSEALRRFPRAQARLSLLAERFGFKIRKQP
jgi:tetratricopeptide (TPR) repeat protein